MKRKGKRRLSRTAHVNTEDASWKSVQRLLIFQRARGTSLLLKPVPGRMVNVVRGRRTHRVIHVYMYTYVRVQRFRAIRF